MSVPVMLYSFRPKAAWSFVSSNWSRRSWEPAILTSKFSVYDELFRKLNSFTDHRIISHFACFGFWLEKGKVIKCGRSLKLFKVVNIKTSRRSKNRASTINISLITLLWILCSLEWECHNPYFVDKHSAAGELLLELYGPGHLVEADKGGVVEGVRVKLHRGLRGGRVLRPLE